MVSVNGNGQLDVDDASGPDGETDRPHVGIDPDMAWLLAPTPPSNRLTPMQERAAELLAEIDQPERVDTALGIARGMVRRWSESKVFREAALRHRRAVKPRVDRSHYESALNPKQNQAALMQAEGKTKTEIASALEIHRSTLHNWEGDPAYRGLVRRLAEDFAADRQAEIRHRRVEEVVLAHRAIERGLRDADPQAAAKLGVTFLRLYEVEVERVRLSGG